jgi:hypothetical protein
MNADHVAQVLPAEAQECAERRRAPGVRRSVLRVPGFIARGWLLICQVFVGGDLAAQPFSAPQPAWGGYEVSDTAQPRAPTADDTVWGSPAFAPASNPVPQYDPSLRLAQAPSLPDGTQSFVAPDEQTAPKSLLPAGTRQGFFQKVNFTAAWFPQLENDSLGFSELGTSAVFGLPLIERETPLVITPEYRARLLERPVVPDLPERLHDVSLELRHFRRVSDQWIMEVATTVGLYADDESLDADDAFRVTGRALAIYESSPEWKWIMGVLYLNRAGASVVPAAGIAYHTDFVQYELVFPRPKAAWMLPGSTKDVDERWVYLLGEFGGGVWAIERPESGTPDTLQLQDYRIILGYENKVIGGLTQRYELGYVFGREMEFDSATPDVSLDDTFLVRVGFTY